MLIIRTVIATFLGVGCGAQVAPTIASVHPFAGAEGARVEIRGSRLANTRQVWFGAIPALFRVLSNSSIVALVPLHAPTSPIKIVASNGTAFSPSSFRIENDPRIPTEVRYKTGYINIIPRPPDFNVALLWGIAIADTRVASHQSAQIEVGWTQLSCRIDGRDVPLNRDDGRLRGGLYVRNPWFHGNAHEPMPTSAGPALLRVGTRPGRIWHFWNASGRADIPPGRLSGCTARARVRISHGALLQLGMDYWRDRRSLWAPHAQNNHEAGASQWYFSSPDWQDVEFTDIE